MQRRKNQLSRKILQENAFQSQKLLPAGCRSATRELLRKTPGNTTWTEKKQARLSSGGKHRNARVTPLRERAMNAKPLKLLLLEDRRKDGAFSCRKPLKDGGSFDCKLVKMDKLEKNTFRGKEKSRHSFSFVPVIPTRKLSANLKRVRENRLRHARVGAARHAAQPEPARCRLGARSAKNEQESPPESEKAGAYPSPRAFRKIKWSWNFRTSRFPMNSPACTTAAGFWCSAASG